MRGGSSASGHRSLTRVVSIVAVLLLLAGLSSRAVPAAAKASASSAYTGDVWPGFHRNSRHLGVTDDPGISTVNAASLTVKWSTYIAAGGTNGYLAITSSPVVAYNNAYGRLVAYVATDGVPATVAAVDVATGSLLWTRHVGGSVEGGLELFRGTLYVGSDDHNLYEINANNGAVRCSFDTGGRVISAPNVYTLKGTGPVVFFGDAGPSETDNFGHEWAITTPGNPLGPCQQLWMFDGWGDTGTSGTKTGTWSPPAVAVDATGRPLVVFGSGNPDDSVYALDARDGSEVWRYQTFDGEQNDVGAGPTISSPGVNGFADGVVYIDGKTKIEYALDLETGQLIWQFDLLADSGIHTNSVAAAALLGRHLVVPYSNYMYELDAVTGARLWRSAAAPGIFLTSPAISGGGGEQVVLAGDSTGVEHVYRYGNGASLLSLSVCGRIFSSTAVADGMAFFGCDTGALQAVG